MIPVQDAAEDLERQPGDADVPHQALLSQLLQRRQRLLHDLHAEGWFMPQLCGPCRLCTGSTDVCRISRVWTVECSLPVSAKGANG